MKDVYELGSSPGVVKVSGHEYSSTEVDRDEVDLLRMGKKPVLKVEPERTSYQDSLRLSPIINSGDLGLCRYWDLAVPFSSPGRVS